jgi:hypothetical protein
MEIVVTNSNPAANADFEILGSQYAITLVQGGGEIGPVDNIIRGIHASRSELIIIHGDDDYLVLDDSIGMIKFDHKKISIINTNIAHNLEEFLSGKCALSTGIISPCKKGEVSLSQFFRSPTPDCLTFIGSLVIPRSAWMLAIECDHRNGLNLYSSLWTCYPHFKLLIEQCPLSAPYFPGIKIINYRGASRWSDSAPYVHVNGSVPGQRLMSKKLGERLRVVARKQLLLDAYRCMKNRDFTMFVRCLWAALAL